MFGDCCLLALNPTCILASTKKHICELGFLQFYLFYFLDEMINFPEFKMKMPRAKISAKPRSKLHVVWIVAENAICELGFTGWLEIRDETRKHWRYDMKSFMREFAKDDEG
ncbi:hypothetical protein ACJX0J_017325, partial [Zea mays]